MRKILYSLLAMGMFAISAIAQTTTTYTTTTDACGGKASQYCTLPVTSDNNDGVSQIVVDSRGRYPSATMYIGGWGLNPVLGTLDGFKGNPDGTHTAYYGIGSFESLDGTVTGSFLFRAFYAASCSGRGCGYLIGWHFTVLTGSTITVTQ